MFLIALFLGFIYFMLLTVVFKRNKLIKTQIAKLDDINSKIREAELDMFSKIKEK